MDYTKGNTYKFLSSATSATRRNLSSIFVTGRNSDDFAFAYDGYRMHIVENDNAFVERGGVINSASIKSNFSKIMAHFANWEIIRTFRTSSAQLRKGIKHKNGFEEWSGMLIKGHFFNKHYISDCLVGGYIKNIDCTMLKFGYDVALKIEYSLDDCKYTAYIMGFVRED